MKKRRVKPSLHQSRLSQAKRVSYSGNYIPARPCRCGKRGYTSRQDARAVLREVRRKDSFSAEGMDIYRCRVDDTHWHLGHDGLEEAPNLNDPSVWG